MQSSRWSAVADLSRYALLEYSPSWENLEQSKESIARDVEALRTGDYLRLGIVQTSNHQLVGACTLFNFNWQCKRAEVGYALA